MPKSGATLYKFLDAVLSDLNRKARQLAVVIAVVIGTVSCVRETACDIFPAECCDKRRRVSRIKGMWLGDNMCSLVVWSLLWECLACEPCGFFLVFGRYFCLFQTMFEVDLFIELVKDKPFLMEYPKDLVDRHSKVTKKTHCGTFESDYKTLKFFLSGRLQT